MSLSYLDPVGEVTPRFSGEEVCNRCNVFPLMISGCCPVCDETFITDAMSDALAPPVTAPPEIRPSDAPEASTNPSDDESEGARILNLGDGQWQCQVCYDDFPRSAERAFYQCAHYTCWPCFTQHREAQRRVGRGKFFPCPICRKVPKGHSEMPSVGGVLNPKRGGSRPPRGSPSSSTVPPV